MLSFLAPVDYHLIDSDSPRTMRLVAAPTAVSFAITAAALVVTPGAGFVLFSSTMFTRGRRAAAALGLGIIAGTVMLAAAVVTAYPRLVGNAEIVPQLLRYVGGGYLLYLGARNVWRGLRSGRDDRASTVASAPPRPSTHGLLAEGATSAITNPGLLVFYLIILPTFLVAEQRWQTAAATLAAEHLTITVLWYAVLFLALGRAHARLTEPKWQARIAIGAGIILVLLGVRTMAREPRPSADSVRAGMIPAQRRASTL